MPQKEHHIVPNNDGWAVRKAGTSRASVVTATKAEAVKVGRVISQRQGSKLIVHDPFPRGEKK